ncbi:MAG TPA: hypothetical protein VGZ02_04680 [Candidatus Baltobacteraceae bacterium]|nr:hypothetical protein [Candidatus Baltobacteraceae bacterium]
MFFIWSIVANGIPSVRHDWLWPASTPGLIQHFAQLGSGWFGSGLGFSNPYPMTYFDVWPLAVCALLAGSFATLVVQLALIAATAWSAGNAIGSRLRLDRFEAMLVAIFLLFNPWTYGKIVSGHLTQCMAAMAFAVVLNETLQRSPGRRRLMFAVIGTALQTQFFLIALALCILRISTKEARAAALTGILVFLPTLVGVAGDRGELLQLSRWPFAIAFENGQSVRIADGFLLRGDFTQYALHPFDGLAIAGAALVALLCLATIAVRRSRAAFAAALCALLALLAASGTTGVAGALWRWCILHAPIVGVYRELYDLIGVVAAAYAVLIAQGLSAGKWMRAGAAIAGLLLIGAWAAYPPARFFVSSASLPPAGPLLAASPRYAIMPPFQPFSFRGEGAGSDPLFVGSSGYSAPINWLLSTYPADAALAQYWYGRGESGLRRLGVTLIECRPGFTAAGGAEIYYRVSKSGAHVCDSQEVAVDHPSPLVSLQARAATCTLCSESGAGNRFYGDLPEERSRFFSIPPLREFADPNNGWVDAGLQFARDPNLAQPLGGAFTMQSERVLAVHPAPYALVDVRGALRDANGSLVAADTGGYRWVRFSGLPLRCFGSCAVAGTGDPPAAPLNGAIQHTVALSYSERFPWLLIVNVNANSGGIIKLLQTYAPGWTAVTYPGLRVLPHVRLDATLNGWLASAGGPERVLVFQATALAQFVAELLGFLVIGFALATSSRTS